MIIQSVLLREDYLRLGLKVPVNWDTELAPMACCFGTTGSGKTYALKLLAGKLSKYGNAHLTVCDGKGGGDFDFLEGCERYASINVTDVFDNFYSSFPARQRGEDNSQEIMAIVFDEWSAYWDGLDNRKQMETQWKKLGESTQVWKKFLFLRDIESTANGFRIFPRFPRRFQFSCGPLQSLQGKPRYVFQRVQGANQAGPDQRNGLHDSKWSNFTPITVPRVRNIEKLHQATFEGVTR